MMMRVVMMTKVTMLVVIMVMMTKVMMLVVTVW